MRAGRAATRAPASRGPRQTPRANGWLDVRCASVMRRHARAGSAAARRLDGDRRDVVEQTDARRGPTAPHARPPARRRAASRERRSDATKCPTAYGRFEPMQRLAKDRHVAVGGVGEHGRERQAGRAGAAQQRQRQAPFLLKPHGRRERARARSARDRASTPSADRGPRPASTRGPWPRATPWSPLGNWRSCPARRNTGARRRPSACLAWGSWCRRSPTSLRAPGSSSSRRRHTGAQSHVACVMKCWNVLVMARVGDPRQHRLHRLARTVAQQALQVATQRHRLQPGTEAALELLQIPQQSTHARPRALIEHWPRSVPKLSATYNVLNSDHCGIPQRSVDLTKVVLIAKTE